VIIDEQSGPFNFTKINDDLNKREAHGTILPGYFTI